MEHIDWRVVFFVLLLIDSLGSVFVAWFGAGFWNKVLGPLSQYFPPAKGWSAWYFILTLIIGYLLFN